MKAICSLHLSLYLFQFYPYCAYRIQESILDQYKSYTMLFSGILYSLVPQVPAVPSHVLCSCSLFLPFGFVPEVIACAHQHPLALTGFSRVPSGYSSTKEGSRKRHWQLFVEPLSPHKTAPAPWDLSLERKVCCCHSHADTVIISGLRKDGKPGCFYILQDLHKNRIHFNSTIILEVMPSVKRKNVFLAGLQVFLFFLFLPVGWSRGQGRAPASRFHCRH